MLVDLPPPAFTTTFDQRLECTDRKVRPFTIFTLCPNGLGGKIRLILVHIINPLFYEGNGWYHHKDIMGTAMFQHISEYNICHKCLAGTGGQLGHRLVIMKYLPWCLVLIAAEFEI